MKTYSHNTNQILFAVFKTDIFFWHNTNKETQMYKDTVISLQAQFEFHWNLERNKTIARNINKEKSWFDYKKIKEIKWKFDWLSENQLTH